MNLLKFTAERDVKVRRERRYITTHTHSRH